MKLFVGNLPRTYTEEKLKELLSKFSSIISCRLITDRDTGMSRCFGFVEFSSKEDAEQAIKEFHEREIDGRRLVVNEARPQEDRRNFSPRKSFSKPRFR